MARKAIAHSPRILFILLLGIAAIRPAFAVPTVYFVHNDHRGAPVAMSDMSQKVVWRAQYLPFGEAIVDEDPDGDGQTVTQDARLPGQYYDKETGFYYNYYRDYDPSLGRYIQADPIGINMDYSNPQMQLAKLHGIPFNEVEGYGVLQVNHLYGYVDQNSINSTDSNGLRGTPGFNGSLHNALSNLPDNSDQNKVKCGIFGCDYQYADYVCSSYCPDKGVHSCPRYGDEPKLRSGHEASGPLCNKSCKWVPRS